jgi:hypothetical protein
VAYDSVEGYKVWLNNIEKVIFVTYLKVYDLIIWNVRDRLAWMCALKHCDFCYAICLIICLIDLGTLFFSLFSKVALSTILIAIILQF